MLRRERDEFFVFFEKATNEREIERWLCFVTINGFHAFQNIYYIVTHHCYSKTKNYP